MAAHLASHLISIKSANAECAEDVTCDVIGFTGSALPFFGLAGQFNFEG